YGSTANDSRSCSATARIAPVIGNLPSSASSRLPVSSRSSTTTYSVPRRRNATRRRSRTARSNASRASGVRLVYSGIARTALDHRHPAGRPPPLGHAPAHGRPRSALALQRRDEVSHPLGGDGDQQPTRRLRAGEQHPNGPADPPREGRPLG